MFLEPKKRISKQALKVWRISGAIHAFFFWLAGAAIVLLTYFFEWPYWIAISVIAFILLYTCFVVIWKPSLRWKRWRYDIREEEIELQHGVFIIRRSLIPMVRVQHVDTLQGPILRRYHLASIVISTAATIHEIPAIEENEAEEMRHFISKLARVAEEDV